MRCVVIVAMVVMLTTVAAAYDWEVAEIGGPDSEGSPYEGGEVEFIGNGFTISSTGGDLWSNKLGITLAYIDGGISGDFTIQYTIEEHTSEPSAVWSKCGVIVMQDIDPDAPYVFLQSTCSNNDTAVNDKGTKWITRPQYGGEAGPSSNGWAPLKWPVTYKVVREGDLFTASVSLDGGKTFESIADPGDGKEDNTTLELEDPVILGIAASGDEDGLTITTTATVTDIFINGVNAFAVEPASKLATTWSALKISP
jgi:hypothetical protein